MGAGEMKAFSGFTLGVFAPRRGKKNACTADDHYSKPATGNTLQDCFLECLKDLQCQNILVGFMDVIWLEKPPPARCTLLGALKDPSTACTPGTGTLITELPAARSGADSWEEVGSLVPAVPAGEGRGGHERI
jgi:hypothetical protein